MSFPVESIAGVRHTQFSQDYQSKGVAGKGVCKSMKTKGRGKTGPSEKLLSDEHKRGPKGCKEERLRARGVAGRGW
jgi:hypothetical protein